jgi:UDP-N-acetylmuramoylalanine--D-glutamate ligase
LDYHADEAEYVEAKSAIVKYQQPTDYAVINADFSNSVKIGEQGAGEKVYFSRQKELLNGAYVKDNEVIIKHVAGQNFQFPIFNFQLRGAHNLENICAAASATACAGCDAEAIKSAIESFRGLEHRLEFVTEKKGVKFYNDSFSTTPKTAITAIKSFNEPLIVILGGSSKKSDFSELGKTINEAKNIKAVVLIGQEAKKIEAVIKQNDRHLPKLAKGAKSMAEIFEQIKPIASTDDVVLLSPACASFDMFKNYKDRGGQFKTRVWSF